MSVSGDLIKSFVEITGSTEDDARLYLKRANLSLGRAIDAFYREKGSGDNSPSGALDKIFDEYCDPKEDKDVMSIDGFLKLVTEGFGLEVTDVSNLVAFYKLGVSEIPWIKRQEFVRGMTKLGVSSVKELAERIPKYAEEILADKKSKTFRDFYRYVFRLSLENPKGNRIPKDIYIKTMRDIFTDRDKEYPLMDQFLDWLEKNDDYETISKDAWNCTPSVFSEIKRREDFDEETFIYPTIFDEFFD